MLRQLVLLSLLVASSDAGRPPVGSNGVIPFPVAGGNVKVRDCEPIRVSMCQSVLGYNVTASPNLVGHETQNEANDQLLTFTSLIQYGCSRRLLFFMCSTYVPMCTEKVQQLIGPCRPLCESVRNKCEPIMNQFGFPWLAVLNCSRFPARNDQHNMCMDGPDEEEVETGKDSKDDRTIRTVTRYHNSVATSGHKPPAAAAAAAVSSGCTEMYNAQSHVFVNISRRCSLKCDAEGAFTLREKGFADVWMALWASLCFASTLFTLLSFLIDSNRFCYPERPIIIMSFCYNICSVGYLMRLLAGRQSVACRPVSVPGHAQPVNVLSDEGLDNTDCTVVFLLTYYFSMSSHVWWVLLSLLWFLAAGLRWTREAIERHSTALHVVAWSLPAVLTIIVLVVRSVDADELTGLCYVGHGSPRSLLSLVIAPLSVCLLLGTAFLSAGLVSLYRVKRSVQRSGVETCRLETLMIRIGVFSMLYIVPVSCALACYCYEYVHRASWYTVHNHSTPNSAVLMLKIIASLIVGTTSGMWIWSAKTLHSWKSLCTRLCRKPINQSSNRDKSAVTSSMLLRQAAPAKQQQQQQQQQQQPVGPVALRCPTHQYQHYHRHHHLPQQTTGYPAAHCCRHEYQLQTDQLTTCKHCVYSDTTIL